MASNSETGHAVNISNMKLLVEKCVAFGSKYNPSNTDLTTANMLALWTTADEAHKVMTTGLQNSKNPINEREILFEPLDKLVTRCINHFNSTKASDQIKADGKGLADRIRGFGVEVKKLDDGTADPESVSNSHRSYVQRGDSFGQFVVLLASDDNYKPNESELSIATLTTLNDALKKANDNIGSILAPVELARIERNKRLYNEGDGIVDISLACKNYVKGLFGATAAESKMVTGIKFTRLKKKKKK